MSLLALALQIAATGALAEAMPDWVRVEMEPVEPLRLAEEAGEVLLGVFIGDTATKVQRRQWLAGASTVELVVQVVVPAKVTATVGGAVTTFDTRKGGTAGVYAAVHRVIERVFAAPPDDGELGTWGAILQTLVVDHPDDLHAVPGVAERRDKQPIPVCDYSIPCALIRTPPIGVTPPDPWPQLVARMRASTDFAGVADHVAALLAGEPLPPWRAEQALAGLSRREGDALGLGTVFGYGIAPEFASATIDAGHDTFTVEPSP